MIFSGPRIPEGEKTRYLYIPYGYFSNLCDLTQIAIPKTVEGKSLLPAIDHGVAVREDLYLAFGSLCRGVKDKQYKLIEYRNGLYQ